MNTTEIDNSLLDALPQWLKLVWRQVDSLHYGTVEIVVHDSHVTQIEKNERVRLDKPAPETKTNIGK